MADNLHNNSSRAARGILKNRQENSQELKDGGFVEVQEGAIGGGIPNSVEPKHFVNFPLAPGECLLQCPYDKSHQILPSRMGNHIDRCRTNYKKKLLAQGLSERFVNCPWDEAHSVHEVESAYHAAQCPSRFQKREMREDIKKYAPKSKVLLPPELEELTDEEDWEKSSKGTYDPKRKMAEQPVFTIISGLSKADKKEVKEQQRLKFYTMVSGPFWADYKSSYAKEKLELEQQEKLRKERAQTPVAAGAVGGRGDGAAATTRDGGPVIFTPNMPGYETRSSEFYRESDTVNWVEGQYVRGRGHPSKVQESSASTSKPRKRGA